MSRHPRVIRRNLGRPATWEDLEQVPEGFIGEIVAGELVLTPRPAAPHAVALSDLHGMLSGAFRFGTTGPGGWILLTEPYVRFGEQIRAPDLAGWRKERWQQPPRQGPLTLTPDWICEVLSSSTTAEDRGVKLPLYARARVPHVWLVDPRARTLEVLRLDGDSWRLVATHGGDVRVRAEPFDAVELDLSPLWLPPDPDDD